MATNTYVALDKFTITTATPSVTLNNISQNYTDLILVINSATGVDDIDMYIQVNSDTGTNYSWTALRGSGSAASSARSSNSSLGYRVGNMSGSNVGQNNAIVQFQNYSNTTTYKTILSRGNNASLLVEAYVGLWRSTSAITSIDIKTQSGNFSIGSTFSLYGIKAWADESTPKATGGYVYSDSTYWYHAFPFSSTFTPSQSLTADYVIVGGGGGGAGDIGGGGGAGGLRYFTSQSLSATAYTITVGSGGAGGASSTNGNKGSNSSAFGISATGGGYGARYDLQGGNGGSGGGNGRRTANPPAGNEGGYTPVEGYAGAAGSNFTSDGSAGGGGGAGGAGVYNASGPSNGGIGFTSSLITDIFNATRIGQLVSGNGYLAGGGGGGSGAGATASSGGLGGGGIGGAANSLYLASPGVVSTGSGGGGGSNAGGTGRAGGSGVVIVRYAK